MREIENKLRPLEDSSDWTSCPHTILGLSAGPYTEDPFGRTVKSDSISQLIFTTHDTHLMDAKILRRDQFWLTERDLNGATKLRSIYDFEGRESEDIEKRYYEGRYRGLPLLKR